MSRLDPSLLAAVTAAPGDDAPRLRCARALRERGDPWAELIEIQCERARPGARSPEELRLREAAWFAEHGAQLGEDLGIEACSVRFERGFVARLFVGDSEQARQVCEGLLHHPVEGVSLFGPEVAASHDDDAPRTAQALAAWLSTTCLSSLGVTTNYTSGNNVSCLPEFFEILAGSARVAGVEGLSLGGEFLDERELLLVATDPRFRSLRRLDVGTCSDDAGPGVEAIVRSERPALRALGLGGYLTHSVADTGGVPPSLLAGSRLRLERLELGLSGSIDVEGWSSSPALGGLRELHLHLDDVPREALLALLDAPQIRRIERVTLFAWGDGWEEALVAGLGRPGVAFEQPQDEWSWLMENGG